MEKPKLFLADYDCILELREELIEKHAWLRNPKRYQEYSARISILKYMLDQFDIREEDENCAYVDERCTQK